MTREEIMQLEGRELDKAVTIHVMGLSDWHTFSEFQKSYSTDISAAWEVFTKFDLPSVSFWTDPDDNEWFTCNIGMHRASCKTGPEAICKAALLAVMGG